MRAGAPYWRGQGVWAWLAVGLVVAGCGHLAQISEEGGLIPRLLARDESATPEKPGLRANPCNPGPKAGLPMPYRPGDFENHAADREFTWHWTATRRGNRVEVKGLIENRAATTPVAGVSLALSGPEKPVNVELPGVIRPGAMRPFYFTALFPGDERHAPLSVVAVDRRAVSPPPSAAPAPDEKRTVKPAPEALFSRHAQDHFFAVHWNTTTKGGETEVSGLVENRDGPALQELTLAIGAYGAGGRPLGARQLVLHGPIDKKEARHFTARLPAAAALDRVTVSVESYEFFQPSAGGD